MSDSKSIYNATFNNSSPISRSGTFLFLHRSTAGITIGDVTTELVC